MRICVVIPAYNEEKNIEEVVLQVRDVLASLDGGHKIVVVDDGSRDETAKVSVRNGAIALCHKTNCGKGAAKRTGWIWAIQERFDYVLNMDADGQHSPDDIAKLVQAAIETGADMILPRRKFSLRAMGFWRLLANVSQSWLASVRTGKRIYDSQCDFRLIKREVLEKVETSTARFEAETEFLIKALRHGFRIATVPVQTIYFEGRKSRINPVIDVARYLLLLIRSLAWG